jgi:hypothetical protein
MAPGARQTWRKHGTESHIEVFARPYARASGRERGRAAATEFPLDGIASDCAAERRLWAFSVTFGDLGWPKRPNYTSTLALASLGLRADAVVNCAAEKLVSPHKTQMPLTASRHCFDSVHNGTVCHSSYDTGLV